MDKKISIDGFLREYSVAAKQKGSAMEQFIKKHINNRYMNFLEKCVYCDSIVNASTHVKDGERQIVKLNTAMRFVAFTMRMIDIYTDIEIDFNEGNFIKQYDQLNKVGAIGVIIENIDKAEYSEFSTILNMKLDDFRDNEYSLTAFLYNFKESMSLSDEVLTDVIKKAIEEAKVE